jgi:hypothetical protein
LCEKQYERRESRKNDNTNIRNVKEAVRETIPAYKRVKGRLREYPKIEIEKEGLELQGEASQTY